MESLKRKRSDVLVQSVYRPSHAGLLAMLNSCSDVLVDFRVRAKVSTGYLMCIVGSSEELGAWDPLKARIMERSPIMENEWHKEVNLTRQEQHMYRFFICRPIMEAQNNLDMDLSQQPAIIIHKWESHLEPRIVNTSDIITYGILPVTEFGWIGDHHSVVANDWLVNTTEFRLSCSGELPVQIYGHKFKAQALGIKCCPLDCGNAMTEAKIQTSKLGLVAAENAALNRFLLVSSVPVSAFKKMIGPGGVAESVKCQQQNYFVADMNAIRYGSTSNYEIIPQDNIVAFCNGQSLCFHICTNTPETTGFRFEIYCEPLGQSRLFGTAFLLPFERGISFKEVQIPIFGIDTSRIGLMSLNCLIVRPTPGLKVEMKVSYQNHWKYRKTAGFVWDNLFSYHTPKILSLKENTPASLTAALMEDVQFIEFSVQLCKDKVPIIYHDFCILTSAYNKECHASEIYSVLVKDLPLEKLQSARLKTLSTAVAKLPPETAKAFHFRPFPTLLAALRCITKPSVGFIIVVEYPQCQHNIQLEVENYFDHNTVVDAIVSSVKTSGTTRKIIFTSSDPNTCILLQKKQNTYPVIYRCQATNSGKVTCSETRAKTFDAAIHFAVLEKFLGVSFLTDDILKDARIVRKSHSAGLVLFARSDTEVVKDPDVTQADAVVTNFIQFSLDYGMTREVFYFSNKKEEIDLTNAHVVRGTKKRIHLCASVSDHPCNSGLCNKRT